MKLFQIWNLHQILHQIGYSEKKVRWPLSFKFHVESPVKNQLNWRQKSIFLIFRLTNVKIINIFEFLSQK